jgi:hypothetical protein
VSKRIAITTLLFALTGLFGPLLRWATWPPAKLESSTFVSDLVLLIWPTQPLAVIEASAGPALAALAAVGVNVLLFAVLGLLAGVLAERRNGLLLLYLGVGVLVALFALWSAGFSFAYLNALVLVVGLLMYAIPFYLTARMAS